MKRICVCVAVALFVFRGGQLQAQGVDQPTPDLPPDGVYLSPDDVHAMYSGPDLEIVLSAIQHQPFAGASRQPGPGPADETELFESSLHGQGACTGLACAGLGIPPGFPVEMNGPVQTVVYDRLTSLTGTFQTEIVAMSLTGTGGIMIRESPTLPSTGQTTITDIGGGLYHIDSFFDVFTELSLDGGTNWIPNSGGPTHVVLGIPEPASVVLMGVALVGLLSWRRRCA